MCNNMDEFQKTDVKQKELILKAPYCLNPFIRHRNKSVEARKWELVKRLTTKWHEENFCGNGNVLYLEHMY